MSRTAFHPVFCSRQHDALTSLAMAAPSTGTRLIAYGIEIKPMHFFHNSTILFTFTYAKYTMKKAITHNSRESDISGKWLKTVFEGSLIVHESYSENTLELLQPQEHLRSVIDMGSRDGAVNLLLHRRDPSLQT
ncbi:hypothetical protein AVEN_148930-1 [Araneus ventricosus]|uniref:Uncharacterized protein n=1 Tax=Araneus ventricosus TaxID=182803 RepID=A0A4Y2P3I8_ARAVE|nr:hypothetical protein AVEN_148930-1 [Araneus ventricosus]